MSLPRPTSDEGRRQLKSATRLAVKQLGGQKFVALITRVGQQTLSDCGNISNDRHAQTFVALDVALDLILDAAEQGEVSPLLQEICRQAGGSFVRAGAGAREGGPVELINDAINNLCAVRGQLTGSDAAASTDEGDSA